MAINVYVTNGVYYLWNAKDWKELRTKYRIIGCFDGAEGEGWTKVIHVNLPFKLASYEARYLALVGIIDIKDVPNLENLDDPVTSSLLERYNCRSKLLEENDLEDYREKKRSELELGYEKILEGKRKKGFLTTDPECDKETIINQELAKYNSFPYETVRFDLADPWINDESLRAHVLPELSTTPDILKYRVFHDLHANQGYYLTSGLKFGGDFIAYKGDPLQFHAEFIIMCEDGNRKFDDLYLLSQCRLATILKKKLLVARIDDATDQLHYALISRPS